MDLVNFGIALALLIAPAEHAGNGPVVSVEDGDTITMVLDEKPTHIRLADIEAPRLEESYGDQSRQSLDAVCAGTYAAIYKPAKTEDGAIEAYVVCAGVDAVSHQVERGMARVLPDGATPLNNLQDEAKEAHRGIWAR